MVEKSKRGEIAKLLSADDNFKSMFEAKLITKLLPDYVEQNYIGEDKEKALETIALFKGFTTYFTDYFNIRKNMFKENGGASSICYRIVNVNASIFYDNLKTFMCIKEKAETEIALIEEELTELLDSWRLEHIFSEDYYNELLAQKGIDYYNQICGDVNKHMNLYCQQNKLKANVFKMTKLQKQIMGISEKAFEKYDYLGKGCKLINSEEFTGLTVEEAKEAITQKLEKMGVARRKANYHFREWIFARQRYWGEPVPIVYLEDGQIHVLDDDELPLILPELEDYKGKNGQAPLENAAEWKQYEHNGLKGKRETSTMPGSAGSSWYYMRYIDPDNDKELCDPELLKHWLPVDLYIGGPEHAVGHLMYSRIWNRYLYDKGISPVAEPFQKLVHQGMILGSNGIKMGKRFPEFVINPSDIVREYGADTLRLYEMFMGPLEASKPWSQQGVEGARSFIGKVWNFFTTEGNVVDEDVKELEKVYNQTVKKVTDDFEKLGFNTAISQMMIFMNAATKLGKCSREYAEGFIKMFSCICPHAGEEMWSRFGHNDTIAYESWPTYDEEACKEDTVEIGVQVNGKVKGTISIAVDEAKESVLEKAKKAVEGKITGNIIKEIYVPGKIVNIVAK